jgi:ribosomal protein S18 acetylase RimI-like enzyme
VCLLSAGRVSMLGAVRVTSLGYRTDLMMRGLEGSTIGDNGDYLIVSSPANPDFWWGNFLLMPESALRDDADKWMSRFREAFPGAAHVALGVDSTKGYTGEPTGYTSAGLSLERSIVLTATSVREPPRPNRAAQYRPLDGDADWRQSAELRLACSGVSEAAGGETFDRRRVQDARRIAEAGHGATFGAFLGGRLVAQLGLYSDGSGTARYQNVETHPAARRQGLAGSLVCHAGRYGLAALGARILVIVADPGYSAIRIYRSAGFADLETQLALQRGPG